MPRIARVSRKVAGRLLKLLRNWGEYPKRGKWNGGGLRKPIPESWDGRGDRPVGYRRLFAPMRKITATEEIAFPITPELRQIWQRHKSKLRPSQRMQIQAVVDSEEDVSPALMRRELVDADE